MRRAVRPSAASRAAGNHCLARPHATHDEEMHRMSAEKINAESRTEFGKGAARRIRRANKVPAVIYGHGNDPIHVTLPGHDTMMALKHGGSNALLDLDIDGKEPARADQAGPVDPIKRLPRAHRLRRRPQGREGHRRRRRSTWSARPRPRPWSSPRTRPSPSRPRPPTSPSSSRSRSRAPTSAPRSTPPTWCSRRARRCSTDDDMLVVNVTNAPTAEEVEAELEEAEAEAGIERDESDEEIAEAEAAPPRARRRGRRRGRLRRASDPAPSRWAAR